MADNNDETQDGATGSKWKLWAAVAAAGVMGAGIAVARRSRQRAATAAAPVGEGSGWGIWRSRVYAGGFCTYHNCATTHRDHDEYWCPHCWTTGMNYITGRRL